MFASYDAWEKRSPLAWLNGFLHNEGLRFYPFFVVPSNPQIFHVEIRSHKGDGDWQRLIFHRLTDLISFSSHEEVEIKVINLQSRRLEDMSYRLDRLQAISEGRNLDRRLVIMFARLDGTVEFCDGVPEDLDDLTDITCIWSENEGFANPV